MVGPVFVVVIAESISENMNLWLNIETLVSGIAENLAQLKKNIDWALFSDSRKKCQSQIVIDLKIDSTSTYSQGHRYEFILEGRFVVIFLESPQQKL